MDGLVRMIGDAVKKVAKCRGSEWWYTPHMAAASRAIAERLPLVDVVLEVRDARIPLSSECLLVREFQSSRRVILLNKMDLADQSHTKVSPFEKVDHVSSKIERNLKSLFQEWMRYFDKQKLAAFAVNSHNHQNIKELLTFLQAKVREVNKKDNPCNTISLMLVGITNTGKSALANSLHQVGRISATEKGKLRHAVVSTQPGETRSITSFKIASHPNIYVLDTPGILPPYLDDDEMCCNLALSGAIKDTVVGEILLARYFLSIMNMSDEYKKWANLCDLSDGEVSDDITRKQKILSKQLKTDHTQDLTVNNVRLALHHAIASFTVSTGNGDLPELVEEEFKLLLEAFHLPCEQYSVVATKLLNLYRTGRLGRYTLEPPFIQ